MPLFGREEKHYSDTDYADEIYIEIKLNHVVSSLDPDISRALTNNVA